VFASAIQTEVANYLAQKLAFNKPYFSFFVTHVAFSFVFPVHLGVLCLRRGPKGASARAGQLMRNLRAVLADQLGTAPRWRQLARPLNSKIVPLTLLISFPAICWYVAMALSPAMDITAIYATSAFHTYFFSLLLLGTRLTKVTVAAIAVAFAGVLVITFDDAGKGDAGKDADPTTPSAKSRMIGDLIMVVGAMGLGLYEVVYKMVLPESEGGAHRPTGDHAISPTVAVFVPGASAGGRVSPPLHDDTEPEANSDEDDDDRINLGRAAGSRTPLLAKQPGTATPTTPVHPHTHLIPQLPAAFHSNFLTSALGVGTLVLLWIPFPFIHATGIETFVWPSGGDVWGSLLIAASMGAIYVSRAPREASQVRERDARARWSRSNRRSARSTITGTVTVTVTTLTRFPERRPHDPHRHLGPNSRERRKPTDDRARRHRGRDLDGLDAEHYQGRRRGAHLCRIRRAAVGGRRGIA
jgi:drug/metabolite transporter (DMT)-like permease